MDHDAFNARIAGTAGHALGIRFTELTRERVRATLVIEDRHRNLIGLVHGGVLMSLADTVGAAGAILALPPGMTTSTIESKTNFFTAARQGSLHAEAKAHHVGRSSMVFETRITDDAGKLVALTIQTQIVMAARADRRSPNELPSKAD